MIMNADAKSARVESRRADNCSNCSEKSHREWKRRERERGDAFGCLVSRRMESRMKEDEGGWMEGNGCGERREAADPSRDMDAMPEAMVIVHSCFFLFLVLVQWPFPSSAHHCSSSIARSCALTFSPCVFPPVPVHSSPLGQLQAVDAPPCAPAGCKCKDRMSKGRKRIRADGMDNGSGSLYG